MPVRSTGVDQAADTRAQGPDRTAARARFDRAQFWMRMSIVYGLALAAVLVRSAGPHRFTVALALATVVGPAHFVVRWITKVPNPTGWLDLLAAAAGVACAAIEPTIWPACLLFQMLTLGGAVAFLRPPWTATLGAGSVVSMAVVALVRSVSVAPQMLVVATLFVPILIVGATRKKAAERKASMRMDAAVGSLPMVVWEADVTGQRILSVVGRTEAMLGRPTAEVLQRGLAADVHPDDRVAYLARFTDVIAGEHAELAYRYVRPDGDVVWLRDRIAAADSERGRVVRGVTLDVTEAHHNEIGLLRHEQIVQRVSAMTVVLEPEGDGVFRVTQLTDPIAWGVGADAVGRTLADALPQLAGQVELVHALSGHGHEDSVRFGPWVVTDATGTARSVEVETFAIPGGAIALIVDDVSEREQMLAIVRHQARHDDLTSLANRAALLDTAEEAIARGQPVTLLLIDLDEFKAVNDTLGHLTGDHYLTTIGQRFASLASPGDLVARLGGDEFALLLVDPSEDSAAAVVDAVVEASHQPVTLHGVVIAGGASVGQACAPIDATTAESLLRCADIAMYRAKQTHQGWCRFDPDMDRNGDQLELLGQLATGFDLGQFEMYFQPKVDARTRQMVGVEALVRWNHPTRGLLAPAAFLDLITVAGLADRLVDTAVRQAAAALQRMPEAIGAAVNLTAFDVRSADLPDLCRHILAAADVSPTRLTFEITESQVLDTTGDVRSVIDVLSDSGIRFAVDDFGTGFSSLTHLRSLPLSELKIDQRFVRSMIADANDLIIVRSMIELAHNLGLSVTAEGVEQEPVAIQLAELGCDLGQGFLYGRPMPLSQLLDSVQLASELDGWDSETPEPPVSGSSVR